MDVIVPDVIRFEEKNKTTELLLRPDIEAARRSARPTGPQPPGKNYCLLKIVTQVLLHGHQPHSINPPAWTMTALPL